ncbi:MAG: response regulator [Planctomycetota bacterium]
MLVITRRSADKISFPQIGVTVHFIRVQGSAAKVGVDAPRDIVIVRDEAANDAAAVAKLREQWLRLPKEVRHEIRNELHAVSVGLHLLREQIRSGQESDAEETFTMVQDALARIDGNEVLKRPEPTTGKSLPGTVLVVDDNDNEREMLAGFLRLQGHAVVCLRDGAEAIDYLETHDAPEVVLMDMRMPNIDGGSAVRRIRKNDRYSAMRIFAISGTEPDENDLQIGDEGVNRWFRKPLNPQFLLDAI